MTMLVKIEDEVKNLPKQEFDKFRNWFLNYEFQQWDRQIEDDSQLGKLDHPASLAINDFKNKQYKTL